MPTLIISPALSNDRKKREVEIDGSTLEEVIDRHAEQFDPTLRQKVLDEDGINSYINVYVNDVEVSMLEGLDTVLEAEDQIRFIPAISGGRS